MNALPVVGQSVVSFQHKASIVTRWLAVSTASTLNRLPRTVAIAPGMAGATLAGAGWSGDGPTADTGGLMQNHAPTIYAYPSIEALLDGERHGGSKSALPRPRSGAVTERPGH